VRLATVETKEIIVSTVGVANCWVKICR